MTEKALNNSISAQALDTLIAAHDGDVALLYIYRLRTNDRNNERAARALCRTLREIEAADEKLYRLGLEEAERAPAPAKPTPTNDRPPVPPAPADELPEYRAEDVVRRSREDGEFAAILGEAQRVMGRALSSVDMKTLFGVYDYLGLPTDVIMLMINHVARQYTTRYGTQRRPNARAIQKEAYHWANREIMTVEQAEEYIRAAEERKSLLAGVKDALAIKGRELTKTEKDYISSWLDLGYSVEAISIAYDRTVTNTGALKWSYMNKIILSWKEKGLMTAEEIEQKDSRTRKKADSAKDARRGSNPDDFKELDAILDKI